MMDLSRLKSEDAPSECGLSIVVDPEVNNLNAVLYKHHKNYISIYQLLLSLMSWEKCTLKEATLFVKSYLLDLYPDVFTNYDGLSGEYRPAIVKALFLDGKVILPSGYSYEEWYDLLLFDLKKSIEHTLKSGKFEELKDENGENWNCAMVYFVQIGEALTHLTKSGLDETRLECILSEPQTRAIYLKQVEDGTHPNIDLINEYRKKMNLEQENVKLSAEIAGLKQIIEHLEAKKPQATVQKPIDPRTENKQLKVLGAMAMYGFGLDIHADKIVDLQVVVNNLATVGVMIKAETLSGYLKQAAQQIEPPPREPA